ncbi:MULTISPECIES: periplasmic heavy metal sensor [Pacificibacter]|uniref:periplasmic heavy metal sensor n=1 Tax=Pacificibacter TaxID=1042323 RepID=UPI001C086E02|nr:MULTISPECIES: periplasmic heavy metal sensor [Pacificibacter]MBU2937436.1 periplasmic heavy metal sensor [Pacificibacter marinus]MDO6615615.1 periplasmic heavy metal sensor [Pacificibacter sp. 1_MG-2023]
MSDANIQKKPSGSRRMRLILILSLAVNLAVVGLVAGAALRGGERGGASGDARARAMQTRDFGFGPYVSALDRDARRDIGRNFISKAGGPAKARAGAQEKFEAILDALKAEPFDADLFQGAMLAQLNDLAEKQNIGASVIVDHVAMMTPEARAAYAVRLDQALKRPPRHDAGPDGGPDAKPKPKPKAQP